MFLATGTAVLRRGTSGLRIGTAPNRHLDLDNLDPHEQAWLYDLGRASGPHQPGSIPITPSPPPPRAKSLAAKLDQAGLLQEKPARPEMRLLVDGIDTVSLEVIVLLSEVVDLHLSLTGRGRVDTALDQFCGGGNYDRPRRPTAIEFLQRYAPHIRICRSLKPDIALISRSRVIEEGAYTALLNEDIPHLLLVQDEDGLWIGPFVRPGFTPCAQCLELHWADTNPHWAYDRRTLPSWPLAAPQGSSRLFAAIEVARVLAPASVRDSFGQREEKWEGMRGRIGASGVEYTEKIAPHPQCWCGAAGRPFGIDSSDITANTHSSHFPQELLLRHG